MFRVAITSYRALTFDARITPTKRLLRPVHADAHLPINYKIKRVDGELYADIIANYCTAYMFMAH